MSNVPADEVGATAGLYKTASSLGSAFGVALSAAIHAAATHLPSGLVRKLSAMLEG